MKNPFDDPKLTDAEIADHVMKAKLFMDEQLRLLPDKCPGVSDPNFTLGYIFSLLHEAMMLHLVAWTVRNVDDEEFLDEFDIHADFCRLVEDLHSDMEVGAAAAMGEETTISIGAPVLRVSK